MDYGFLFGWFPYQPLHQLGYICDMSGVGHGLRVVSHHTRHLLPTKGHQGVTNHTDDHAYATLWCGCSLVLQQVWCCGRLMSQVASIMLPSGP